MDRILRVVPGVILAAVFGLAIQSGFAADADHHSSWPSAEGPELGSQQAPWGHQPATETPPREISAPAAAVPLASNAAPEEDRSEQLEKVARQADEQTRHGLELAGRGAFFAARSEFIGALKLVADGLDTREKTDRHGRALSAALAALKEAEDFMPGGSRLETQINIPTIVAGHVTPVLKADDGTVTPMTAMKRYFTFAQEQFTLAAGREIAGSMALHSLGKLHSAMAHKKSSLAGAAEPKAMVCFQAALLVYPQNYMSANDLGVLLARCGDYANARAMLERSLAMSQQSATCRNLAVVYRQLGQGSLSSRADRCAMMLQQTELMRRRTVLGTSHESVAWIDSRTFATTSANTPSSPTAAPRPSAAPNGQPQAQPQAQPPVAGRGRSLSRVEPAWIEVSVLSDKEIVGKAPASQSILLCQALGPAAPYDICGIDCADGNCRCRGWEAMRAIQWQAYAQGEYVGHARLAHVPEYRIRVDDELDMTYRLTRDETPTPYRLNVGDEVLVESFTDHDINRSLLIQPDGTITLRLLGQVHATGRTVTELRDALDQLYKKYYKVPAITVTPLKVNTKLDDLRATIDRRAGIGGQSQAVRVTPEGSIALPGVGSVQAQGLTLPELQTEVNESYRQVVEGMQVVPLLVRRAPRYVFVLGEVNNPGRFELTGPTTALQALSMAGSWRVGANLRQIVVFRRGDDWRLLATTIDLQAALLGHQPCPKGEIWIDDSDVIIVPKSNILVADDFIDLVFTRGIYGVFPMTTSLNFTKLSTL